MATDSALEPAQALPGQCPRCCEALVEGTAFAQLPAPVSEVATDEGSTAKLVACMKCPDCGYSEEMPNERKNGACREVGPMSDAVRAHYAVFGRAGIQWDGPARQYGIAEPSTLR